MHGGVPNATSLVVHHRRPLLCQDGLHLGPVAPLRRLDPQLARRLALVYSPCLGGGLRGGFGGRRRRGGGGGRRHSFRGRKLAMPQRRAQVVKAFKKPCVRWLDLEALLVRAHRFLVLAQQHESGALTGVALGELRVERDALLGVFQRLLRFSNAGARRGAVGVEQMVLRVQPDSKAKVFDRLVEGALSKRLVPRSTGSLRPLGAGVVVVGVLCLSRHSSFHPRTEEVTCGRRLLRRLGGWRCVCGVGRWFGGGGRRRVSGRRRRRVL
mmetsp:Transcript_42673/g.106209  ORF Transcript_42673/g.106209 Transcript_42673/m.106209 type:complete len:268 (+) Transcript_42673:510-1313(+)